MSTYSSPMRRKLSSSDASRYLREPPIAVGPGPHIPSGLGGDQQLIAVIAKILAQNLAEVFLGRPVRRPIVVRQVEVRHARDRTLAE